jgi:hypothetical protein
VKIFLLINPREQKGRYSRGKIEKLKNCERHCFAFNNPTVSAYVLFNSNLSLLGGIVAMRRFAANIL